MAAKPMSPLKRRWVKFQFGHAEKVALYNQLLSLLDSDVAEIDALHMAYDAASFEGKHPDKASAIILADVIRSRENGEQLSTALSPWVPQEDTMVLEAIQNSSDFAGGLREYIDMVEKKKAMKSRIIGGMGYPIVLLLTVYGLMLYFGKSVVPLIAGILPMEKWTGPTAFLRFMSNFANHYAAPVAGVAIAIVALVLFLFPRWTGKSRVFIDRMPIFSVYRIYTGISFLMSVASLMQGGMPAVEALERLYPKSTPYVRERILKVRDEMKNGANFGAALHRSGTGWPDPAVNLQIKIFAQTQDLSKQLTKLSRKWLLETGDKIDNTMTIARYIALLMVFGVIMGIVMGITGLQSQVSTTLQG